ncbi:MAG: sodium:calcium antiporter [Chloroflexi bacterium]|nr:sodium:calcium antiporter [Chloroflexota bacterium]
MSANFARHWTLIAIAALLASPAPVIRLLEVTGVAHPELGNVGSSLLFGLAIMAAATLLIWASDVAETEISATLALVLLALIAVLPEYAVDLFFAWTAPNVPECIQPDFPLDCAGGVSDIAHPRNLAIANMTGANRLLVGLAWPMIFLIYWWRTRSRTMAVERSNSLGILFLGAATLYSFSIPIRGHLSLIDTAVMFAIFAAYMFFSSRSPSRQVEEFVGPSAAIGALSKLPRRLTIIAIFVYAAVVIFAAAEPFAEGLVATGMEVGIDEFILVQWLAPLASESPEFLLAGLLAARGRHGAAMTILIASKVGQWTLLIGSLPLAFSISGGTLSPLEFDARQAEEVYLTAAQSLFAVAIFVNLRLSCREAILLAALFITQLFFFDTTIRLVYGSLYLLLALLMFLRDIPAMPNLWSAAREAARQPQAGDPPERAPP